MKKFKTSRIATLMIYIGTLLVSVLSFFTTYQGLTIFLDNWLALIGSLGLQIAMLGIAWNLMRLQKNRLTYVTVFGMVAVFSIFFSYVNFNSRLKGTLRTQEARAAYADACRPVLRQYSVLAKRASAQGTYQVNRLGALLDMEETHGWATVIDEGSNDPLIQSVIEGARRTVDSWTRNQGKEYQQGSGRGIILDYLCNWNDQTAAHRYVIETYVKQIDSLGMLLGSEMSVAGQYDLINWAAVHFPVAEFASIMVAEPELAEPPFTYDFVERPVNGQQALGLVIGDLFELDRLTSFSLIFAIVIDLMVIIMALCGSQAIGGADYMFSKIERDANERLRKLSLDDPKQVEESLRVNIERLRQANEYRREFENIMSEYESSGGRITLTSGEEIATGHSESSEKPTTRSRIII